MKYKYTVKIKGENVPEFKEGLGKGVIAEHYVEFEDITEDNEKDGMAVVSITEKAKEIRDQYVEVGIEKIP